MLVRPARGLPPWLRCPGDAHDGRVVGRATGEESDTLVGPGLLLVVSGPSGAGKDTLVRLLRDRLPHLRYSVSATTRAPRPGEVDGQDYFFLARERFEERLAAGEFLESREYAGNLYGTPRPFVEETIAAGGDLLLKPEVNGALAIRQALPRAVLVFLVPGEIAHLERRLAARSTESADQIAARLATAREELTYIPEFDYLVVNEHSEAPGDLPAVADLEAIVRAERLRIHRDRDILRKYEPT